ncbi:MAG: hypothetical protein J0M35_17255 [Candidatus Obscuribacter phosphatis]|uniref:Uncharacterized protein n=1 Tax=Candidatus Obscuribacter phosphatis TaxID=1906157 RepID=A0A8J7P9G9_9BACT|nr:hypothetical protein [Candidatus Obscuribacter phosphatis]
MTSLEASKTSEMEDSRNSVKAVKVGELLVGASIVSSAEMTEAIQVSKRLAVPIGRVLTMSGCVREDVLEGALQLQRLIKEGSLSVEGGIETLKRVHEDRVELAEALTTESQRMALLDTAESLGELLLDSNIISEDDLVKAMQTSFDNGVPLGTTLVLQGLLSPSLFPSILSVHKNIVRGVTGRDEGVKEIQEIFLHWLKAEESLRAHSTYKESERKNDQIEATAVTTVTIAPAIDKKAEDKQAAEKAVKASEARASESKEPKESKEAKKEAKPVADSELRLVDLLKQSGLFSQGDVQKRYEAMLRDPERSARFFIELGLIGVDDAKVALRAHGLLSKGNLSKEEAIYAVRNDRVSDYEKSIVEVKEEKVKRYMDQQWRGRMSTVIGGALVGAVVAGFSISRNKKGK